MSDWRKTLIFMCIRCGKKPRGRFLTCDKCDEEITHESAIEENEKR